MIRLIFTTGLTDTVSAPSVYNFRLLGVVMVQTCKVDSPKLMIGLGRDSKPRGAVGFLVWQLVLLFACGPLLLADDARPENTISREGAAQAPRKLNQAELQADSRQLKQSMSSVLKRGVAKSTASPSVPRQSGQRKFDGQVSPAVHVNATGLENTYGSRQKTGAAGRLQAMRDTPLLKIEAPQSVEPLPSKKEIEKPSKTPTSSSSSSSSSSSRRAKRATESGDESAVIAKPVAEIASLPKPEKSNLPSVVTRRGLAKPTLAVPNARKPAKLPAPEFDIPDDKSEYATPALATPALATPALAEGLSPGAQSSRRRQPPVSSDAPDFVAEIQPLEESPAKTHPTPRVASRTTKPRVVGKAGKASDPSIAASPLRPNVLAPTTTHAENRRPMRTNSFSEVSIPDAAATSAAGERVRLGETNAKEASTVAESSAHAAGTDATTSLSKSTTRAYARSAWDIARNPTRKPTRF